MAIRTTVYGWALAALVSAAPLGVLAQDAVPRSALHTDWSVFSVNEPQECFIASAPTNTVAKRNGKKVSARRGEIRFYVTSRPGDNVRDEVAFTGGYPYKDGSTVTIEIGNDGFELFTDGEWAWPASADEDRKIIASMRRGAKAIISGVSARGTTTVDTFSLIGFTAALEESATQCFGQS